MSSNDRPADLNERVAADVLAYSSDRFDLGADLEHLDGVWRMRAPEATIFYAARILEALTADALESAGLSAGANVLSNLVVLQQFNLIPTTTRYWAHALRRSGNSVRHLRERVGTADAELALELVERVLKWFFCDLHTRNPLSAITRDGGSIWIEGSSELHALLAAFDDPHFDPIAAAARFKDEPDSALLRFPAVSTVLAEMLLDDQQFDAARSVLTRALETFNNDLRLQQLMGLLESLTGNLRKALTHLEPLYRQSSDEGETAGITAGVYKRLWKQDRTDVDWLKKSHDAYCHGWEQSRSANAYLGINTATTALWLGLLGDARKVATKVRDLLQRRQAALGTRLKLSLDYWERVSLAESELLVGNLATAREIYQRAMDPEVSASVRPEVTLAQLDEILPCLHLSATAEQFLAVSPSGLEPTLNVGVIGHRKLPADERLVEQARSALERTMSIHTKNGERRLRVLSALADGADRLLATLALSPEIQASLTVVLPLEVDDYCRDFLSDESVTAFRALLNQADSIVFPPPLVPAGRGPSHPAGTATNAAQHQRNLAYDWAGRYVVDHCDVLIAIWDGASSGALGGTAEIVKYARGVGKPLIAVRSLPPYAMTVERFASCRVIQ